MMNMYGRIGFTIKTGTRDEETLKILKTIEVVKTMIIERFFCFCFFASLVPCPAFQVFRPTPLVFLC
jgi:hypothetical protein